MSYWTWLMILLPDFCLLLRIPKQEFLTQGSVMKWMFKTFCLGDYIPYLQVHLINGVPVYGVTETCTAGAGTLLVEFGILSRLIKDPIYESYARRTLKSLWELKNKDTGLLGEDSFIEKKSIWWYLIFLVVDTSGNTLDIQTGKWTGQISGIGAGMDSYFEYLLKSFILFNEIEDLETFQSSYETIKTYLRKGYLLITSHLVQVEWQSIKI